MSKEILVVEDEDSIAQSLAMLLESEGYQVSNAENGKMALEKLQSGASKPCLILLDLMFPNNITGYDVFENIRENREFRHIPIVAVSASEPTVAIPKTQALGFAGFIPKPIDMDKFPKQVAAILRNEPVWDFGGLE